MARPQRATAGARRHAKPDPRAIAERLLADYGRTFAAEVRIPVSKNTPAPLFQLLNLALLLSARIPAGNAVQAARALIDAGYTTPRKMAASTWQQRVDVITWHGYKRYDERTSTMLGDTAQRVLDEYGGDLRRLRDAAGGDIADLKKRLIRFSGIGSTGADIFLREAQVAWRELHPYADQRVLRAAGRLGLGKTPDALAKLVPRKDFARLATALLRVDLAKAYDDVRAAA
jgi:endonuclease III